jgi:hypothetical protein
MQDLQNFKDNKTLKNINKNHLTPKITGLVFLLSVVIQYVYCLYCF